MSAFPRDYQTISEAVKEQKRYEELARKLSDLEVRIKAQTTKYEQVLRSWQL